MQKYTFFNFNVFSQQKASPEANPTKINPPRRENNGTAAASHPG